MKYLSEKDNGGRMRFPFIVVGRKTKGKMR
jgi:hypothetical protein